MKRTVWKRVGSFIMGKGFYIVLFLCVATIGISGYYLVSVFNNTVDQVQQTGVDQQVVIPDKSEVQGQTVVPVEPNVPDKTNVPDVPTPQIKPEPKPEPEQQTIQPIYTWPVRGDVISNFSLEVLAYDETMGDWRTHSGVDIAADAGTRVQAISSGTVTRVYKDELMGCAVVIQHPDGLVSAYYNLADAPAVSEGTDVVTGTVIGTVGETAIAEAGRPSHVHLEMLLDERPVDPVDYLPKY